MSGGPSKATRAVAHALEAGVDLFHDPDGEAYADVPGAEGVRQTIPVCTRAFRRWLSGIFFGAEGAALGGQSSTDAVDVLAATAVHGGPEREVHVRLAGDPGDEAIYLDLADDTWRAVRISPSGWELLSAPPVRFRRPRGLRPLPVPVRGGNGWAALRKLLHVPEDRDWALIVSWMVGALHPSGPYPILGLTGEQGTSKTMTGRILRANIDPSEAPLRSPPREDRDLVIAAKNSHIVAFDNLSRIREWLSDALCRIATGGGYSARQLYTDGEEVIYSDRRPILLTSIEDVATRGDLADRTIAVTLPLLPEKLRRTESELEREMERIRPAVLGDLLDAVATALRRRGTVKLDRLPRMADFASWIVAAEPALPWEEEPGRSRFIDAYDKAREDLVETGIEADPVATALLSLIKSASEGEWYGTATELLATIDARRDGKPAPRGWPETPQAMGGRVTRAAPLLRASGWQVCRYRGDPPDRTRKTHLHRTADRCPGCPSSTSRPAENPRGSGQMDNMDNMDNDSRTRANDDLFADLDAAIGGEA